jgi:hypothetical protein
MIFHIHMRMAAAVTYLCGNRLRTLRLPASLLSLAKASLEISQRRFIPIPRFTKALNFSSAAIR